MPQDRGVFVHVYPGVSAARFLYLSLGFREDEFIRQEDKFTRFWFSLPNG